MNLRRIRRTLFVLVALSMFGLGCELIVDFDRTQIPVEDAGQFDATQPETGTDASDAQAEASEAGDAGDADADASDALDEEDGSDP